MKKNISILALVAFIAIAGSEPLYSQKSLHKEEFQVGIAENSALSDVNIKVTRQFYYNDKGVKVYDGDVTFSKGDMSTMAKKETYTLNVSGKMHYTDGVLDGPVNIKYTFTDNVYYEGKRASLTAVNSITGTFEKGLAVGTWTTSYDKKSSNFNPIGGDDSPEKYNITATYEKGKMTSFKNTFNGKTYTIDKYGNITGRIEDHNFKSGVEVSNGELDSEVAALMDRGEVDSAVWKAIEKRRPFLYSGSVLYTNTFKWDLTHITMDIIFERLGGIVNQENQFGGECTFYYLPIPTSNGPEYWTYEGLKTRIASLSDIKNLHYAINKSHVFEGKFLSNAVAEQIRPQVDTMMKNKMFEQIEKELVSNVEYLFKNYNLRNSNKKSDMSIQRQILLDTLYRRAGDFSSYRVAADKVAHTDSANYGFVVVPSYLFYNYNYPDLPDAEKCYVFGTVAVFDFAQGFDKVDFNDKSLLGFVTTPLQRMYLTWDTIIPLAAEWDSLMRIINGYGTHSEELDGKYSTFFDAARKGKPVRGSERELKNYLERWLPDCRLVGKVIPDDYAALKPYRSALQKSETACPQMNEYLKTVKFYDKAFNEEQMVKQAAKMKQYYTNCEQYLTLMEEQAANDLAIKEKKKSAKKIVGIYNDEYEKLILQWDPANSTLPLVTKLVENQRALLNILAKPEIEDLNKQVKKAKCETVDQILDLLK